MIICIRKVSPDSDPYEEECDEKCVQRITHPLRELPEKTLWPTSSANSHTGTKVCANLTCRRYKAQTMVFIREAFNGIRNCVTEQDLPFSYLPPAINLVFVLYMQRNGYLKGKRTEERKGVAVGSDLEWRRDIVERWQTACGVWGSSWACLLLWFQWSSPCSSLRSSSSSCPWRKKAFFFHVRWTLSCCSSCCCPYHKMREAVKSLATIHLYVVGWFTCDPLWCN
ncbi:hypothetical protein BHM03_00045460 [Ensete ventricosum]|nr:hypothetical protein BHM03_00045460 [Ensete ventricosum]